MLFQSYTQELDAFLTTARIITPELAIMMVILWVFNFINWMSGGWVNAFGIRPRTFIGLFGIFLSPLLHANFAHLFFNSLPLFVLALLVASLDINYFIPLTLLMAFLNGAAVWLIGRRANHIGASGLVSAYFGYGLALAYFEPSIATIILGFVAIYYFGSIFLSLFPSDESISWEGHMSGFVVGLLCAWKGHDILFWIYSYTGISF